MKQKTTIKEIKRIAFSERAQIVDRWSFKDLAALSSKVVNCWYSESLYGLGAVLVEDNEGNYYFASSRSGASVVLF